MNHTTTNFSVDGFAVTPMSRLTEAGTFSSAVSIRRGTGQRSHDRVFRFVPVFAQQREALAYALCEARQMLQLGHLA